jgi:phosphoribosylanthranilate isomerase
VSDGLFVKICGITRPEDAALAASLGASAIGFIFWKGSPRYIEPARAKVIVRELAGDVAPIGVFVDQPAEEVRGIADEVGLAGLQLHGTESPEYCSQMHRRVIKAIALDGPFPINEYSRQVLILIDASDKIRFGGTGKTADWVIAGGVAEMRPVILAGGLTPANVAEAIAKVQPYGVDVSSSVESRPGIKDADLLRQFFAALPPARAKWNHG